MRRAFFAGLVVAVAVGCGGGPRIAPVSGVVTLNNKPYKDAVVSFQPVGGKDEPNPGRGSAGMTDAAGKFTLVYDGRGGGAVVGKHRVRIFTHLGADIPDTEGDPDAAKKAGAKFGRGSVELLPAEWNEESRKEFDVPAGGTTEANFAIVNPKVKN